MHRYRKYHRVTAVMVLACFLTALTGVSALAGHDCCGNCAEDMTPRPTHAQAAVVAVNCCPAENPVEPVCACSFQSSAGQDQKVYSLAHVSTTCDDQPDEWALAAAAKTNKQHNHRSGNRTTGMEIRARSGPLYLINQSFLC
jgi:hypothetical protein